MMDLTCKTIGSAKEANLPPPPEAVKAVKELIKKYTGFIEHDLQPAPMTKVGAPFLTKLAGS